MINSITSFLANAPVRIYFAGFSSTTHTLVENGWSINVHHHYYDDTYALALRHGNAEHSLYMLTNYVELNDASLNHDPYKYSKTYKPPPEFNVQYAAPRIRLIDIPVQNVRYEDWYPTDATPKIKSITDYELSQLRWFTPINPDVKDLLLVEEDVPKLMDIILDLQKPKQDLIKKRRQQRINMSEYKEMENGLLLKDQENVKLQIIGV